MTSTVGNIEDLFKEQKWQEAYNLALSVVDEVHPDYVRKAAAHWSHQLRHDEGGEGAREVLDIARRLPGIGLETFYGKAMLEEEEALLARYFSGDDLGELGRAISAIEKSLELYVNAEENVEHEIVDADEIESRKLRAYGVASTIEIKLAEKTEDEAREHHIAKAVEYAGEELQGRIARDEQPGFHLANAYCGMGMALGISGDYSGAMEHLTTAQETAVEGNRPLEASVYNFRMAAEVHRSEPENVGKIGDYLDPIFEAHGEGKTEADGRWTKGVFDTLMDELSNLVNHVAENGGVDYNSKMAEMYVSFN
jgi:tetratricopeptide (TPR) repeat protein